jgi:hypothetical protein
MPASLAILRPQKGRNQGKYYTSDVPQYFHQGQSEYMNMAVVHKIITELEIPVSSCFHSTR